MQLTPSTRRNRIACWVLVLASLTAGIVALNSRRAHRNATSAHIALGPVRTQPVPATDPAQARSLANLAAKSLTFEPNLGQTDSQVKFLSRNAGYDLFLTSNEAVFKLNRPEEQSATRNHRTARRHEPHANEVAVVRMRLRGASPRSVKGQELTEGRTNYFLGHDPNKWVRNVPQYSRISYDELYPGVDLAFYGHERTMEFDFIVKPGADPQQIALSFEGTRKLHTDQAGDLVLASGAGDLYLKKPFAYQQEGDAKKPIDAQFVARGSEVTLQLGAYDTTKELVIDPAYIFSTYLGGSGADYGQAIAVDSTGIYLTGGTGSPDFPTKGPYQKTNAGNSDAFITKIKLDGSALIYSTFLGGSGNDSGNAIAVDANGNAYISGGTSSDETSFIPTPNAAQPLYGGGPDDAFVAKIDPTGSQLLYMSFVGGTDEDIAVAVAIDSNGAVYAAGETLSTDFPVFNSLQGVNNGDRDAFVVKIDATNTGAFEFADYFGGSSTEFGVGIGLDTSGNIYLGGITSSKDLPMHGTPFQSKCGTDGQCNSTGSNGAQPDSFFVGIKSDLSGYIYSTYFGGSGADEAQSMAVDPLGNAFIAGQTDSTDLPTSNPYQSGLAGSNPSVFVAEVNGPSGQTAAGSSLRYGTYLGGSGIELPTNIFLDAADDIYVTGQTQSKDFPIVNPVQNTYGGQGDAFVSLLNPAASGSSQLAFSTYLGGAGVEDKQSGAVTADSQGNIYVTGDTASSAFPTLNPLQSKIVTAPDAFLSKISPTLTPVANYTVSLAAFSPGSVTKGSSATATVTVTSINGFNGSVGLNCNITPSTAEPPACSFKPAVVPLSPDQPSTATLTMKTSITSVNPAPPLSMWLPVAGLAIVGAGFVAPRGSKKTLVGFALLVLFALSLALFGCASGGSSSSSGTTSGTYSVTVTGVYQGASATSSAQSFTVH